MTIGIIPAAGKATRIHGLPKFLLPVPGGYLLERLANRMGVPCWIGTHPDNAALMETFKPSGSTVYQVASLTMCETILAARPYTGDENMLMGMPDTYWTDEHVFDVLRRRIEQDGVICAAALFAVDAVQATRLGVCSVYSIGGIPHIDAVVDKDPHFSPIPGFPYANVWGAMSWTSEFWQYIHPEDANPSFSMQRAINAGVRIGAFLASGHYYDCGVPDDYFRCIRELTQTEAIRGQS